MHSSSYQEETEVMEFLSPDVTWTKYFWSTEDDDESYWGSEDNCDGGGDAEGQKNKKDIVPACVKLTVWEFFKYEEKQHWNISLVDPEAI